MKLDRFDTGWVVGFVESQGVFTVNSVKFRRKTKSGPRSYQYLNPAFYLVDKNKSALEVMKHLLRMGKINKHGSTYHFDIRSKGDTIKLAAFLDGKLKSDFKARQFAIWKDRVVEWKTRVRGHGVVDARQQGPSA